MNLIQLTLSTAGARLGQSLSYPSSYGRGFPWSKAGFTDTTQVGAGCQKHGLLSWPMNPRGLSYHQQKAVRPRLSGLQTLLAYLLREERGAKGDSSPGQPTDTLSSTVSAVVRTPQSVLDWFLKQTLV